MYYWKLAIRNLFRNTKRTVLTMVTIFVGCFSLVAASGMTEGVAKTLTDAEIKTESGHLRILKKGYLKEESSMPLDIAIKKPQALAQTIKAKWKEAVVIPRIIFNAKLTDGTNGLGARGIVLPPDVAEKGYHLSQKFQNKKPLPNKEGIVVIGTGLAKTFGKNIGDSLTIEARTQSGSINAIDFKIHEIISTGNAMIDGYTVYLPQKAGEAFLQMKDATDLIVYLPKRKNAAAAAALVHSTGKQYKTVTWQEKAKEVEQMNKIREQMFGGIIFMLMLLAAAGLANTMLMAGFERKGEIGMMMAQGMTRARVVYLFAIESGMIGFISSVLGTLAGVALVLHYKTHGFDASGKMNAIGESGAFQMTMVNIFYFELAPSIIVFSLLLGVGVSILAAVWPALRITSMDPKEIMAGR